MPKKTNRARKAGEPGRGHATAHGESQRESSARMAGQRISNVKRIETKKRHMELDPKTGRPKR
jgi:hypothetical protein